MEIKKTGHNHPSTFADRITQLTKKVDSLRKQRQDLLCSLVGVLIPREHVLMIHKHVIDYYVSQPQRE